MSCPARMKRDSTPEGWTLEAARAHPTYRYLHQPGAQCELEPGHDGPHRAGLLSWHDPPVLLVDGQPPDLRDSQHWVDGQVVLSHEEPPQ